MITRRRRIAAWASLAMLICASTWTGLAFGQDAGVVVTPLAVPQSGRGPAEPMGELAGDANPVLPAGTTAIAPAPTVAPAQSRYRSELERVWFESGPSLVERGARTRDLAVSLGTENYEAAARAMIARESPDNELDQAMLAVRLAPDLPMVHMALARAHWQEGEHFEAVTAAVAGLWAIPRHPEASIWLVGSLLVMFAAVLVAGALVFISAVGISFASVAAHDAGDLFATSMPSSARAALFSCVLLIPLAMGEGILGAVLVLLLVGVVYGSRRHRVSLASAVVLMVVGIYVVLGLAGTVLTALDSDPIAEASLAIARGGELPLDVEQLEAHAGDRLAATALAVRSRRMGDLDETEERYQALLDADPRDAIVLGNLGNVSFVRGDLDGAIQYYERAAVLVDSATLMFNLSQAYARAFRMEEFENALHRAQSYNAARVEELSGRGDPNFVADLPLPVGQLRERMLKRANVTGLSDSLVRILAPGVMGARWFYLVGMLFGTMALGLFLAGRYQHASSCDRCGRRICARCDDSMWSADLCDGCHHLFHRPQGTDPSLRTARINALQAREARIEKIGLLISLAVPGVAGLRAKRPDLAFIGILLFGWAVAILIWRDGVVPDPLALGGVGPMAFLISGITAGFFYLMVLLTGLVIRRNL